MKLISLFRLVIHVGLSSFLLLILSTSSVQGQSTAELREQRAALLEEIQSNNRRLSDTRKNKKATLEQLALLQQQINNREKLVLTLQAEITHSEQSISRTTQVVFALKEDIERLQTEFSNLLRAAYRSKLQNSWLSFLLSSRSFNEVFRRWRYLRQYRKFRTRQTQLILATRKSLEDKLAQLESGRTEKAELLVAASQQQLALNRERNAQAEMLSRIKSSENKILTELQQQEKAREDLSNTIEQAITIEMDRQRRAQRQGTAEPAKPTPRPTRPSASSTNNTTNTNTGSTSFESNKGRLPWPVDGGTITKRFGKQEHPTVPGIQITNNGIDITVDGAAPVKVIADGVVVSTRFVPGYRNMILVKHGDYYTVYSNLESVSVQGQAEIKRGQTIGMTSAQADSFHFELWRQKQRLNPAEWILKR